MKVEERDECATVCLADNECGGQADAKRKLYSYKLPDFSRVKKVS